MKRRILALLLTVVFIMSAAGCKNNAGTLGGQENMPTDTVQNTDNGESSSDKAGSNATDAVSNTSDSNQAEAADDGKEKVGNLVYENGTVSITLHKTYMDIETQDQLDLVVAEEGFVSGKVNDDDTVTVVMKKDEHDAYVKEIEDNIKNALSSIVEDEEYTSNITKAETNDDYTQFTITTTEEELGFMDTLLGYTLLVYGEIYNIFTGVPEPEVNVVFKNAVTGAEVSDMKDALTIAEELFGSIFTGDSETVTFDEVDYPENVLVDNELITFTVKSIDANGTWGYTLNVEATNKTDKYLNISADTASVNDWAMSLWWGVDVEPGATEESEMEFDAYSLSKCGITDVFAIEFMLTARDADDWASDDLYRDKQTVYPHGIENSAIPAYEVPEEAYGLTLTDAYNIYLPEMKNDELWGTYDITMYIENNSDRTLVFNVDDIYANGWLCDTYVYETIPAGKRVMTSFSVPEDVLTELGTDVPTAIELGMVVNSDENGEDVLTDDIFTIYPEGYDYYDLNPINKNNERPLGEGETLLEDNEYFSFVVSSLEKDDWGDYSMRIIVTNKSARTLTINMGEASEVLMNGQAATAYFFKTLAPGKSAVGLVYLSVFSGEESVSIEAETIEMPVSVCDMITYDYLYEKTLIYKVK